MGNSGKVRRRGSGSWSGASRSGSGARKGRPKCRGHTPQDSVRRVLISLSRPWACRSINHWKYVTYGQCNARPTVTFPAARRHRPLTVDRYQIVLLGNRGTCVCEQLAQGCYLNVERPGVETATFWVASQHLNRTTPGHTGSSADIWIRVCRPCVWRPWAGY